MSELQCKEVTTRKPHYCEWCAETIPSGDRAQYRAYVFDGEFCSGWQHPECFEAMEKSDPFYISEGWMPGDVTRGVPMR